MAWNCYLPPVPNSGIFGVTIHGWLFYWAGKLTDAGKFVILAFK